MRNDQRSVTVGKLSADAMWADLAKRHKPEEPPPGSMTAREFAEKFGFTLNGARSLLDSKVARGEATVTRVRALITGQVHVVRSYMLKT